MDSFPRWRTDLASILEIVAARRLTLWPKAPYCAAGGKAQAGWTFSRFQKGLAEPGSEIQARGG